MASSPKKPLARNLGQFVGHIFKALRTDPVRGRKTTVRKTVEESDQGDVVLRRTTIEEVELKEPDAAPERRTDQGEP